MPRTQRQFWTDTRATRIPITPGATVRVTLGEAEIVTVQDGAHTGLLVSFRDPASSSSGFTQEDGFLAERNGARIPVLAQEAWIVFPVDGPTAGLQGQRHLVLRHWSSTPPETLVPEETAGRVDALVIGEGYSVAIPSFDTLDMTGWQTGDAGTIGFGVLPLRRQPYDTIEFYIQHHQGQSTNFKTGTLELQLEDPDTPGAVWAGMVVQWTRFVADLPPSIKTVYASAFLPYRLHVPAYNWRLLMKSGNAVNTANVSYHVQLVTRG